MNGVAESAWCVPEISDRNGEFDVDLAALTDLHGFDSLEDSRADRLCPNSLRWNE